MDRGRRRKPTRLLGLIIVPLVIFTFVGIGVIVYKEFKIDTITITGSDKYTYEELYEYIFADRNDSNVLLFKITDSQNAMPEIPFIAKVAIETKGNHALEVTVYEKSIVGYVVYKGTNMYFDKDGIIVEASTKQLTDVPMIKGLEFDSIVMHQKLQVGDEAIFGTLLDVTQYLEKYNIVIDYVQVDEDSAIDVIIGDVTVKLGQNDFNMGEKIYELSCMVDKLTGLKGTLHMEEYVEGMEYITFIEEE